ncbi:16S rRNA (uracil(1498)-N(3))-methyltransferase [Corynebacterium alimapuense]|uniref:Ribosomal RNA small subunit methyltransferase E n=1 Tax=Corynebacterium alimapuense TaxID=1576874 RepID=A0A3M8K9M2_9CORY|nr:16S rRNA (uracil(1498)-N(3))-methyltransferase [Corynebacterium alimapuense]RNE49589.1 16S rRNA (uracil(1498)-N(3))-methyltransferase [Corynebacterium alimapuense]
MSLPVFLHPGPFAGEVTLAGPEGRHAVAVKRIQPGEQIMLIDGRGAFAEATVTATTGKTQLLAQVDRSGVEKRPRPAVTVVQALPKAERSELAVDLATQAGADEIVPWQAQRCVAKWTGPKLAKGVAKWETTALAAAKQSRRTFIPIIHDPVNTAELAQLIAGRPALVLHEDSAVALSTVDLDVEDLVLIIGPEGGIGPEEVAELTAAGAQAVRLGPEVLRTASAAMVALSAIGVLSSRW